MEILAIDESRRSTGKSGFFLLSFLQHKVRRLRSSLVLRYGEPKSGQIESGEQRLPLTEHHRCKCKVQGIYQPRLKILPHRGNTAPDFDIFSAAACFASISASTIPPVTKWKVVPPSITSGSR
jgi:hypothetical protein